MSLSLNKVILAGHMTADPELRQTPSGVSVTSFRIAVNRRVPRNAQSQQPEADFFNVTVWRDTADFVAKYFRKGSAVCVCGRIQNRSWVDAQNNKHYSTDIIADDVRFVESRGAQGAYGAPQGGVNPPAPYGAPQGDANSPDSYGAPQGGASQAAPYNPPAYASPAASSPKFEEVNTDDDLPF